MRPGTSQQRRDCSLPPLGFLTHRQGGILNEAHAWNGCHWRQSHWRRPVLCWSLPARWQAANNCKRHYAGSPRMRGLAEAKNNTTANVQSTELENDMRSSPRLCGGSTQPVPRFRRLWAWRLQSPLEAKRFARLPVLCTAASSDSFAGGNAESLSEAERFVAVVNDALGVGRPRLTFGWLATSVSAVWIFVLIRPPKGPELQLPEALAMQSQCIATLKVGFA